jgi:large subunit ribosomal protein L9
MKVVLRKDVPTLGKAGDVKDVADGYGRNFLIPRGLAAVATKTELQNVEAHKAAQARYYARMETEHRALAERIEGTPITLVARAGEGGRLYGSITAADVAESLSKAIKQPIDKRDVEIDEHIRSVGDHTARVHIAPQISANLKFTVEADA